MSYIVTISNVWSQYQVQVGKGTSLSPDIVEISPSTGLQPPSNGLRAWFKADSINLSSGSAITTWGDSSGNGFDLIQNTANQKPSLDTNVIGGKPAVRFNPDPRFFNISASLFTSQTAGHIFLVLCGGTGQGSSFVGLWSYPHTSDNENYTWTDGQIYDGVMRSSRAGPIAPGSPAITTWHTYENVSTATAYSMSRNSNVIFKTGTNTVNTSSAIRLLGYSNNTFAYCGWMAELLHYDHQLTDADRTSVVNYLRAKYTGSII